MHIVEAEPTPVLRPFPPTDRVTDRPSPEAGRASLLSSYEELRRQAIREDGAGHGQEALRLCDEALHLAERIEDEELVDQAYCNRSEVALVLGHSVELGRLREILMRNRSYKVSFAAAYQLAFSFGREKKYKKALFYARIAHDRALASGDPECIAKSHNEIGNCFLAESYFEKAVEEYERALELVPERPSVFHLAVFINLAYSKIVLRDFPEGFRILHTSLRWCRRLRTANVYESWTHLALAYGFLEVGRLCYAWRHGRRGLELAESSGNHDAIKMALYLLGEIEKSGGDFAAAHSYYSRLQREFCPEMTNLAGAMLLIDTKELVNLRA